MKRNFLLLFACLFFTTAAFSQTQLQGKITDDAGEPQINATVVVERNGTFVTGVVTDFDGYYSISLDPGTYDIIVSYTGFPDNKTAGVKVLAGQATKLDIKMVSDGVLLDEVVVTEYKVPLIQQDNTTAGGTITSEQIRSLPTKNIAALAANTAGLSQADEGDDVTIRGARANGTDYYIDGIRVSGNLIPETEIDQLQVITGGVEAQYGDVTGGIISITTKGPSAKYSGSLEVETSEFLDSYGYNLINGAVSGPIWKRKSDGRPIIGFRFSGRYRTQLDDDPAATDIFSLTDEARTRLEENPIRRLGTTQIPEAVFLTDDDIEVLDFQPNEEQTRLDGTVKIDARITDGIDLTFTGTYNNISDKFTPGGNNRTGVNWRLLNNQNNPTDDRETFRGFVRFRHRLGQQGAAAEGSEANNSIFRNAQYTLQFGYERDNRLIQSSRHQDRFFDYGYVGRFNYDFVPAVGPLPSFPFIGHVDFTQQFTGFEAPADAPNPGLINYNNVADVENINNFVALNGQFIGDVTDVFNLHTNINQVYNLYRRRDNETYTFTANSSFNFLPGGSDKGQHNIQFGIWYEQRVQRGFDLEPRELWVIARQQANANILGVDTTNVIAFDIDTPPPFNTFPGFPDTLARYGLLTSNPNGLRFFQSVRDITGATNQDFVNVDALSPDQLSLDMFAPRELTDQDLVNYWGYNYDGSAQTGSVTFEDFFRARDANGVRTFPVAPNEPLYAAAYIQDKFTFKDIIFRLGLRVDRFDANTQVLRDPFSLYEIQSASEFFNAQGGSLPSGIDPTWKVYTESETNPTVKAYRDGEQWFFPDGTPANDGNVIFGGEVVTPALVDPDADIQSDDFNTDISFRDYEAQVNWMPRLAFSFPISDAANFFANYDILVQRPPSNTIATALDYYYFNQRPGTNNAPLNNPDLRPEKNINYEVGFQQRLSNTSAIKISAYYREMRDMIQRRTFLFVPAPVNSYVTFGNQDFGTVKGFTFQYDLRRTGNVSLNLNYTLQFADGTGSDANSQRGLSQRGNLRNLFPLSFDERHRVVLVTDYRYSSGTRYNGPELFGKDILADFGVNLQTIAVSGRPYTARFLPTELSGSGTVGQINGARLPWNFTLNLRIDKRFDLTPENSKNNLGLNVYLRVQNLLDTRNTVAVYPATGSPTDDGYLQSAFGQAAISNVTNSGLSVDSFLSSYQWRLLNPNFFSLPRRIFLGAIFEF